MPFNSNIMSLTVMSKESNSDPNPGEVEIQWETHYSITFDHDWN